MSEYPSELVDAAYAAYRSSPGSSYDNMRAALEAADKWRAEQPSTQAAAEAPATIGERVTDIDTLRVGDRVSFLAGDRDERFFGVVNTLGGLGASVRCDGVNPAGDTEQWGVSCEDVPIRCGWRDLRLVSRAPVEAVQPCEPTASSGKTHDLKVWPPFFDDVEAGRKTFEVRINDRGFSVGDTLVMREWDPSSKTYTGRRCARAVSYLLEGGSFGIIHGAVVMGLSAPGARHAAAPEANASAETRKLTDLERAACMLAVCGNPDSWGPHGYEMLREVWRLADPYIRDGHPIHARIAEPSAADAQAPGLLEEVARLTRRVAELESDYRIQAYADRVREIEALKRRAHGAEGLLAETQAGRDEWKAWADDAKKRIVHLEASVALEEETRREWELTASVEKERAERCSAMFSNARAAIGEAWFSGDATLADAIRRKCMALESAVEKAPALPYEEDAELVDACCLHRWYDFNHFEAWTKSVSRSEMRGLLRVVREYHQSRAKAQAVAEPEPRVEQVTRADATTVAEMLLSFAIAVDAYAGGSESAATLISSVKRDIARVLTGELKSWTNNSGKEPTT